MVPKTGALAAGLRVGLEQSGIGVVQPVIPVLAVSVNPAPGQVFPMWSEAVSLTPADLRDSYSNFPNPFAAGRQSTAFVYYLPSDAQVTLRIWTSRGDEVLTLLSNVSRNAGLHQEDQWDGRNGRGIAVVNGVYVAELSVRFADGSADRVLRKLAVVR